MFNSLVLFVPICTFSQAPPPKMTHEEVLRQVMGRRKAQFALSHDNGGEYRYLNISFNNLRLHSLSELEPKKGAYFIEGFRVDIVTQSGRVIGIPAWRDAWINELGKIEGRGLIHMELPLGIEALRGYRIFNPDGAFHGEFYYQTAVPEIEVEVNEVGDFLFKAPATLSNWRARLSFDGGKTWFTTGLGPNRWNQIFDETEDWKSKMVIFELTLIQDLQVVTNRIILDGKKIGYVGPKGFREVRK